ncbi:SpoIID/LytB domain-containing protein [Desulfitibacter alkalitolerans]|uniref:SpoIID/LytB domain-containing protein n=1 Tax=Desulfitibacter alkalitolerans TaxID=264641 RepID=UPI000482DDE0|nr:SpoIID/LytB domain-containing protein [Desulfitibacter alkalitolerans]
MTDKIIKKIIVFLLSLCIFMATHITPMQANTLSFQGNVNIRVSLSSGISIANFRVERGSYYLIDEGTGIIVGQPTQGALWSIVKKGPVLDVEVGGQSVSIAFKGPLALIPHDQQALNLVSFSNTIYRDNIRFINENEGVRVINELDVERYLYGVVGPEMGTSADLEALKAQAVVSRSYALASMNPRNAFDITNNTTTQVYRGYSAETLPGGNKAVKAVDDTSGEVIYYGDTLVQAFYHANAGGYTASSENVWHNPLPYLKATPSPYDIFAYNYPNQSGGWPANTYKWEKTVSLAEAQQMIEKYYQNSNSVIIGSLLNLSTRQLDHTTKGSTLCGRVTEVEVYGSAGTGTVTKDQIRNIFGLRSTKFEIKIDSAVHVKNGTNAIVQMNSADGLKVIGRDGAISDINGSKPDYAVKGKASTRQISKNFSKITFDGYGHGHGVGMSQWGARGMAANGYNYREIIEHYYNPGKYDGKLRILNYYARGK